MRRKIAKDCLKYSINNRISCLRTEVRGDFNIHGTKYFQDAVFHQKSNSYDVVSLLYLWWAIKNRFLHEILTCLVITENPFGSVDVNITPDFYS